MIKNQRILAKLSEKTEDDWEMQRFINRILTLESQGKQYKKFYKEQITIAVGEEETVNTNEI